MQADHKMYLYFVLISYVAFAYSLAGPTPPYNLQCERNMVGVTQAQLNTVRTGHHFATDNPNPLLSWTVGHSERGARQKAFRVIVSREVSDFSDAAMIAWDSGVVTGEQQEITYQGKPLGCGEHYFWKVIWWDHEGNSAESEETGHFLAVIDLSWDGVCWITARPKISNAYKFVKKVDFAGRFISKAILYVTGLGYFKGEVSGFDLHNLSSPKISLAPGWTNYEVRVGYLAFDVTAMIEAKPDSDITVTVGEGYRNTTEFPSRDKTQVVDADERVVRAQLQVTFTDGRSMLVKSDETWEVHTSNVVSSSVYNGEVYDALVSDSIVGMASEVPGPAGMMYLAPIPPIVDAYLDSSVAIHRLKGESNMQIVDFGTNFAGVVNIDVSDVRLGENITMKHAEVLMHPPYGPENGSLYVANLRSAEQMDMYISNGLGFNNHYQPSFTYHGFRYVAVGNYPRDLTVGDLLRIRTYTNVMANSNFNTSTPLLNNIQENVVRGQASNLMTIPTDCDQRNERLGWMGDVGLSSDSMAMNFHLESYFPHRVMLIKDEQINGSVPDVTPFYHGGRRPADPSWGAAYPQLVYVIMKQYGDMKTAREYFSGLIEYLDFMESLIPPGEGIGNLTGPYGDWVPPPEYMKIDNTFPSASSLLMNIQQVVEIAEALGENIIAANLSFRFYQHVGEFNQAFSDEHGMYDYNLQISYALPLYMDIVPIGARMNASARFINLFSEVNKYHITAGIIGTKYILPVLTQLNQNNAAIQCVNSIDYPSYGYMIHNKYEPATTIWERWNGDKDMSSRNHHIFSSVSGWMQTDMIGFQQVEGTYGYKEIDLYPASALDLSAASIELDYPKPIKYSWHRRGGLQCGKAAEDRSSLNPGLPKHNGLIINCGEGVVSKVVFASYGNALGVCGYQQYGDCHSAKSMDVVEKLCLNRSECRVKTGGDFWGDPCPGQVEVKWLTVAVQCSLPDSHKELLNRYSSLSVDVSIPMHSTAHVNIPAYGLDNLQVWDGNVLIYSSSTLLTATNGILSASWIPERDLLKLDLTSGDYSLTVMGQAPNETKTVTINGDSSEYAQLKCTDRGHLISRIDWVSYGDPTMDETGSPRLGHYHSHASQLIVEDACVGKSKCSVSMDKDLFFAGSPNQFLKTGKEWNMIAKYSCNLRV